MGLAGVWIATVVDNIWRAIFLYVMYRHYLAKRQLDSNMMGRCFYLKGILAFPRPCQAAVKTKVAEVTGFPRNE